MYVYNLPRVSTSNVNEFNKRKWFHILKKSRNRRYSVENMADANYVDDIYDTSTIVGYLMPNPFLYI